MDKYEEDDTIAEIRDKSAIIYELESPINLTISNMITVYLKPLLWYNYDMSPEKLKLKNTGKTVIANGKWLENLPFLTGGPLSSNYNFSQFHLHWGLNEMAGSEHYVDGAGCTMELHAVHIDRKNVTQEIAMYKDDGIVIVVYLFKLQSSRNESLNNIIQSLSTIKRSHSSTRITPEPLNKIMKPFSQNYFYYRGLLIGQYGRCKVLWLISRIPIGITIEQVAEFRKLNNAHSEPILKNCKPLKNRKNGKVYHVNPSGSTHSSLLPIFQD